MKKPIFLSVLAFFVMFMLFSMQSCFTHNSPTVPTRVPTVVISITRTPTYSIVVPTLTATATVSTGWVSLGAETLTGSGAQWPCIAGIGDTIYVAYIDLADNKAKVSKYTGGAWGAAATVSSGTSDRCAIYIDNNIIYVGYVDLLYGNKLTVKKSSDGTVWTPVGGEGITAGSSFLWAQGLRVSNGIIYLAYQDNNNGGRATIMKHDGSWSLLGTPLTTSTSWYTNAVVDPATNTIYAAYQITSGYSVESKRMAGGTGSWTLLGSSGFNGGIAEYIWLQVYNSTAYVAFRDASSGGKAVVRRFDGASWVMEGSAISDAGASSTALAIENGNMYVSYCDENAGGKITVNYKTTGSWAKVGTAGISTGVGHQPTIYVYNSVPYVAYIDAGVSSKMFVKKYVP